ncbi:hypothetical protein L1049_026341 [Liquidambar formosana]|uniref:Thioredoxin domain-containing protein n=1 Tax=Liquidambar formosana TaxID=63359 RepID=A0AAP0NDH3_LIQFO
MAEIAYTVKNEMGCGLMGGIFHSRSFWPRKTSVRSLATNGSNNSYKVPSTHNSKKLQGGSGQTSFIESSPLAKPPPKLDEKSNTKTTLVCPRPSVSHHQNQSSRPSDARRSSTSSSNGSSLTKVSQIQDLADLNRLRREVSGISTELSGIINDRQQSSGSKALVRATSGNVMLLSHLGNLRQPGAGNCRRGQETNSSIPNPQIGNLRHGGNGTMGNIVRKTSNENQRTGNSYRGPVNKLDPEVLKCMGNEEYKVGRFEEALALYNRAIALDSTKASYYSNKAAALTGLGHLIEAVFVCREAIRIEPYYHRAHHRLADTISQSVQIVFFLGLGEAEKALSHYKYSCPKADSEYIAQAQALQTHLSRCTEDQKLRDWNTLLEDTQCAISSGADSSPEIYALQAEALLKLHRHQEAYATFQKGPNFDIDCCTQFFGPARTSYLLMIQTQLYMAMGRFEDALAAAQHAARLDSTNKDVSAVLRRVRAVASARLRGNQLFKASKFSEACGAYEQHVDLSLANSRKPLKIALRLLDVRPSYGKARLRRADCHAKLERWEASIQDYEMLIRETPGDEEVARALFMSQVQLKKQRGEDTKGMKFGSNLFSVSSNERFRHLVTSPGMSVVLFCNKTSHKQALQLLEQVCKRFPSVNFLKVEVEEHPYLAKSEGLSSIPAFKIYKNGSRVKEILGNNRDLLEGSIKLYSS